MATLDWMLCKIFLLDLSETAWNVLDDCFCAVVWLAFGIGISFSQLCEGEEERYRSGGLYGGVADCSERGRLARKAGNQMTVTATD